jgi:hypothetical protein
MTIRLIIEAEGVITYWICSMEAVPKKERANDRAICLYAVAPPASPRKGAVIADQTATATSKTCVDVSDGNLIDQPGGKSNHLRDLPAANPRPSHILTIGGGYCLRDSYAENLE